MVFISNIYFQDAGHKDCRYSFSRSVSGLPGLAKRRSSYVIQHIKVEKNTSVFRVSLIPYVLYFVKTTYIREVDRPEIPLNVHTLISFADILSNKAPRNTLVGKFFIVYISLSDFLHLTE